MGTTVSAESMETSGALTQVIWPEWAPSVGQRKDPGLGCSLQPGFTVLTGLPPFEERGAIQIEWCRILGA